MCLCVFLRLCYMSLCLCMRICIHVCVSLCVPHMQRFGVSDCDTRHRPILLPLTFEIRSMHTPLHPECLF